MRQIIPLLLLAAGCAPTLDQAGRLVQLNAGYSQLPLPSEERPVEPVRDADSRDLALWLTPERADAIKSAALSSSLPPAPPGNIVIKLVEAPSLVSQGICETALNGFFGEDQTVQGKPTVRVFSGYRQVLYRAADDAGGCTQNANSPEGFAALSPEAAKGALQAYAHALDAMSPADRNAGTTGFLAPSQIVSVTPCLGETRCLSFRLAPSPEAAHGWDLTYRYSFGRQVRLSAMAPPPPS